MQTNNFEKHLVQKLKKRKLTPSESAWERLSSQLDEVDEKRKKRKRIYIGYAASILVIISISLSLFYNKNLEEVPVNLPQQITANPNVFEEVKPQKQTEKTLLAKEEIKEAKKETIKEKIFVARKETVENKGIGKQPIKYESTKESLVLKEKSFEEQLPVKKTKQTKFKRIQVNADDLLYAVTHSPEEVKSYYAKYNINRKSVIDTIQMQLRKSNLKIDPETILAEVEMAIEESDFKQNFMHKFKAKLSDVIVAIADRNN